MNWNTMNWISGLGLILFLAATVLTYIGTTKSTGESTKKIDSLLQNITAKDKEIAMLKGWNTKISVRLLEQVHTRIEVLFRVIFSSSTIKFSPSDNFNESLMLSICKNCSLTTKTGSKKIISETPLILDDLTVREEVINNWFFVSKSLDEINFASTYLHPQAYELALRIKKSNLAMTIGELNRPIRNVNLEAWGKEFYGLFILNTELSNLITKLNNEEGNIALENNH